jgi:hypothetical protein
LKAGKKIGASDWPASSSNSTKTLSHPRAEKQFADTPEQLISIQQSVDLAADAVQNLHRPGL